MFRIQRFVIGAFWIPLCFQAFAQEQFLQLNEKRNNLERKGMLVLSTWSGLNIASGTIGWLSSSGESSYFHQMNAGWNLINLGLGLTGYIQAKNETFQTYNLKKSIDAQRKVNNAFLFNSALNGTYITTGILLKERAKNSTDQSMMLRGFGNSLILQGGFLLIFDATSYVLHHRNRKKNLDPILLELSTKGTEIGMTIHF